MIIMIMMVRRRRRLGGAAESHSLAGVHHRFSQRGVAYTRVSLRRCAHFTDALLDPAGAPPTVTARHAPPPLAVAFPFYLGVGLRSRGSARRG